MVAVVASFTADSETADTVSATKPTGVTSGDTLVLLVYCRDTGTFSSLTGWTQDVAGNSSANGLAVYTREADGTEPAAESVTNTGGDKMWAYLRITGGDYSTIVRQVDAIDRNRDVQTVPAATSPAADSLDLLNIGWRTTVTASGPAGYAEEVNFRSGNGIAVFSDTVASGALASEDITLSSSRWAAVARVIVGPSAGGGTDVTVTPGTGAVTVTGAAPTVSADASVTSGLGTASVEGFAPTVTTSTVVNVSVTPGTGTATVSGFAPNISAGVAASPETGTATVDGFAPSVSADVVAAPGAATATVEGFVPTFTTLEVVDVTVSPGTGATSVSGSAPSVAADATVTPGTGSVIVRGFAPVVNNDGSGQPAKMRRSLGIGLGL